MELPTILPEWRTPDVLALCVSMREAQDFSALPILADALQDAGCPEGEPVLSKLRGAVLPWAEGCALVALVLTDDAREAVERVGEIAEAVGGPIWYGDSEDGGDDRAEAPFTFVTLMDAAREYVESVGRSKWGDFYVQMGNNEAYRSKFPAIVFWEHYQTITGAKVEDTTASFFSCSC